MCDPAPLRIHLPASSHFSLPATRAAPVEGLRTYNETAAAAEKHPGWRAYVSPTAEVKPLLATAIAYTFPAEQASGCCLFRLPDGHTHTHTLLR